MFGGSRAEAFGFRCSRFRVWGLKLVALRGSRVAGFSDWGLHIGFRVRGG